MDVAFLHRARVMLIRDEADRRFPYDDKTSVTIRTLPSGGKVTIGIGRNISDKPLSDAVVNLMFAEDAQEAEDACLALFGRPLWASWSENRRLGWLNMAFNLGQGRLSGFVNTVRFARAGDWKQVEANLKDSRWYRQVGSRAERVIALICREEWRYGA